MDISGHIVFAGYMLTLCLFSIFGLYKVILLFHYIKNQKHEPKAKDVFRSLPKVTVQLPVYNEMYVVERLIRAACDIEYPKHLLEIQVLDDSTDETVNIAKKVIENLRQEGNDITYLHRIDRVDFKAGALAQGLKVSKGDYVAIFDADFLPSRDFISKTIHFFTDSKIGMVQCRWGFLNENHSLLTRLQAVFLNGHFVIEHTSRNRSGKFFNFNGTAGIWRKEAIFSAGGWQGDTLTEDLDLSYRAQLKGWQFIYLKDLVIPSELPLEIGGFKGQQFRWVKGMTQVGIKLLPQIWKSDISLGKKLDSTFHLLSNTGYITTTIMALLVVPTIYLFEPFFKHAAVVVIAYFIITNFLAIYLYFAYAEKETGNRSFRKSFDVMVLMVVGIGLSINGTKAILEALRGKKTQFVRTPKYSSTETSQEKWYLRKYLTRSDGTFFVEILFALYFLWCAYLVFTSGNIYFLIPLCLFGPGYFYLAYQSIYSKRLVNKANKYQAA